MGYALGNVMFQTQVTTRVLRRSLNGRGMVDALHCFEGHAPRANESIRLPTMILSWQICA